MRSHFVRLAFAGLAPRTVDRLLGRYGTPERVVAAMVSGRTRATQRSVEAVRVEASRRETELAEIGARIVVQGDPGFPSRLERFPDSPRWLFLHGEVSVAPSIGIIGTRTCTRYGTDLAERYGSVAGERGWSVVSGLALGIDGAAHRGAVAVGGHCHAVLGSGIDVVYPRSHRGLHRSIVDTGGVISSEFPPGTPPEAWRFPTRNSRNLLQAHLADETASTLVEGDAMIPRSQDPVVRSERAMPGYIIPFSRIWMALTTVSVLMERIVLVVRLSVTVRVRSLRWLLQSVEE